MVKKVSSYLEHYTSVWTQCDLFFLKKGKKYSVLKSTFTNSLNRLIHSSLQRRSNVKPIGIGSTHNTLMKVHFLTSLYYRRKKVIKKASSLKMEISAERLDEPKKKFWLVLSQLISKAAAAATACIAWGEGTILATYWWIFRAQKVLLRHHRLLQKESKILLPDFILTFRRHYFWNYPIHMIFIDEHFIN